MIMNKQILKMYIIVYEDAQLARRSQRPLGEEVGGDGATGAVAAVASRERGAARA